MIAGWPIRVAVTKDGRISFDFVLDRRYYIWPYSRRLPALQTLFPCILSMGQRRLAHEIHTTDIQLLFGDGVLLLCQSGLRKTGLCIAPLRRQLVTTSYCV